jgi:hypothetical protein
MEAVIKEAVDDFVQRLNVLSTDPYLREGIMKLAIRETTWAILAEFEDQYALADQLQQMAEAVREHEGKSPG